MVAVPYSCICVLRVSDFYEIIKSSHNFREGLCSSYGYLTKSPLRTFSVMFLIQTLSKYPESYGHGLVAGTELMISWNSQC